jgi:hypothetical protein
MTRCWFVGDRRRSTTARSTRLAADGGSEAPAASSGCSIVTPAHAGSRFEVLVSALALALLVSRRRRG